MWSSEMVACFIAVLLLVDTIELAASRLPMVRVPLTVGVPPVALLLSPIIGFGVGFLIKNTLLVSVARNGLNLTALGGPDQVVSLATVIRLHLTQPEIFAGGNPLAPGATWCKA